MGCLYPYDRRSWFIMDLAIFNGIIYVLTNYGRIGVLKLIPLPIVTLLDVNGTPALDCSNLLLVTSNDHLFMVDFHFQREIGIYKLDFERMIWMKMESLGEDALFMGNANSSALMNTTKWGGRSNCVYYLDAGFKQCSIYSLDGKEVDNFSVYRAPRCSFDAEPFVWYFSHQCYNRNVLLDDFLGYVDECI